MSRPTSKTDLIEAATANYEKMNTLIAGLIENKLLTPFDFSGDVKKKEAHWKRDKNLNENDSMGDYRRMIRSALNTYSHCTPEQVNWNIYLESTQDNCCTMELNTKPMVININAYYIDRYICIHLYEVINVIFEVYNDYFKSQLNLKRQLQDLSGEITIIIEDFLRFINEEKLDISVAPELLRIKR